MTRISVVIPTLNEEKYISSTLDSVISQDYDDFEVLIIDGGSSDRTKDITSQYDVRLIETQRRGVSAARNIGVEESSGQYILFVDADTTIKPDLMKKIDSYYKDNPKSFGAVMFVLPKNEHRIFPLYAIDFIPFFLNMLMVVFLNRVLNDPIGYGICMTLKKEVFKDTRFNEDFSTLEDHDVIQRSKKYGKFGVISSPALCSIRRNRNSLVPHKIVKPSLYPLCYITHTLFWFSNFTFYKIKGRPLFNTYPKLR